jgi:hypothetical protein
MFFQKFVAIQQVIMRQGIVAGVKILAEMPESVPIRSEAGGEISSD